MCEVIRPMVDIFVKLVTRIDELPSERVSVSVSTSCTSCIKSLHLQPHLQLDFRFGYY